MFNLLEKFNIKHKYNRTLQEVRLENNSIIKLTGADATDTQIEKALGGKYRLVIFDECQVIKHDLERWIKDRLGPAMIDQQGIICCIGTTGDYMGEHFWYKLTRKEGVREPGWKVFEWPWDRNPYMKDLVAKEIDEMVSFDKDAKIRTGFRQEYLCEWVIETSARIYKYNPRISALEDGPIMKSLLDKEKKWKYIIGLDFGYEDPNAIVVGAFYKHDPNCYIVDSFKQNHLQLDQIAELLDEWRNKYNPIYMIGDAQDKIVIETLRQKHRLPIIAADKPGKFAHITSMNSDFEKGTIKVIEANNRALIKEWNELIWSEKQRILGVFKENPTKENHLADACLYLHNFSKHYRSTPEPVITEQEHRMNKAVENLKKQMYNNDSYKNDIYDTYELQEFVDQYKRNL